MECWRVCWSTNNTTCCTFITSLLEWFMFAWWQKYRRLPKLVHFQFVKECSVMHDMKCRMHYRHYETIKHFTVTTALWLHHQAKPSHWSRQSHWEKKVGERRTFFWEKWFLETEKKIVFELYTCHYCIHT